MPTRNNILSEEESQIVNTLRKTYGSITNNLVDDLTREAEALLLHGDVYKALQTSKSAIAASKYLKNPQKLVRSLGTCGNVLVKMDRPKEALAIYLAAAHIVEDAAHRAILYGSIGNIYINTGNAAKALHYHEKALEICEKNKYTTIEVSALINLGSDFYKMGDYEKALNYLKKTLRMSNSLDLQNKADIHSNIGVVALEMGYLEKALEHLKKGFSLHKNLQFLLGQASDALNIGNIYYERGQLEKALFWYGKSIKLHKKIDSVSGEASATMSIGNVFLKKGNIAEALKNIESALTIYDSIQDVTGVANAYANLGLAYSIKGDMKNALTFHKKAAAVYASFNNKVGEAGQITHLGSIYADAGNYEKALQCYNRSLTIYQRFKYPKGKAGTYNNMGLAQYYRGEFTKALEHFQNAMTIYETIQFAEGVGRSCANTANVFYSIGEYEKARQWYGKALKAYGKEKFQGQTVNVFLNMGNVFFSIGETEAALKNYQKALRVSLNIGYKKGEIEAYTNIGTLYVESDANKALHMFEKALTSAQEGRFSMVEASVYLNMGLLYVKRGESDKAIPCYHDALRISGKNGYIELEQKAYTNMGRLHDLEGEVDEAFQCYEHAVECSELMRDRIDTPAVETRLAGKDDIYEMIVVLTAKMGDAKKSFQYLERAKSHTLARLLRRNQVIKRDEPVFEEERILENEINYSYYQMLRHGEISGSLLEKRSKLVDLRKTIAEMYPDYAEANFGIGATLEEIQEIEAQILEYFIIKDTALTFFVSGSEVKYTMSVIPPIIRRTLLLEIPTFLKFLKLQDVLYGAFVQPFEKYLDNTTLCIIPHGFLHHFPFGALFDGKKYLVEKYKIVYAPSATVLKFCLERNTQKSGDSLVMGHFKNRKVEKEISFVSELLGSKPAEPVKDVFLKECSHKDIIHMSYHGEFLQGDPLGSYIKLQDGRLEAKSVFNLALDAEVVTLSACESGVNEVVGGDELMGLTRAFLFAGAKSLVHTLWPVYGISTTELMVTFYKNFLNGQSRVDSLRNAQLNLLNTKRFKNPYYWAPFVLVGDWH